jgi:hypothetical protein
MDELRDHFDPIGELFIARRSLKEKIADHLPSIIATGLNERADTN